MDKNNFSQKLAELTALAAVSENKLQMTQVLDAFAKEQVTPEEMESVYAKLEKKGGRPPPIGRCLSRSARYRGLSNRYPSR